MKTPKTILFLGIVFLIIACSKETPADNNDVNPALQMKTAEKLPDPENLISLEKAKEQLDNYNAAHPEEVGKEFALRTWISIEDIKAYIQYVEESSAEKGIEVTGIDIIHTQYKKAAPGAPNPNNETNNKTLMLAPTYNNGTSNIAFDPIYSEQGKPKDLKVLLSELTSNTGAEEKAGDGKRSSVANVLSTCPNQCD